VDLAGGARCSTAGSAAPAATGAARGFFRALSEEQEAWAVAMGFDEIVVKTKNRFYDMRGTLDTLRYDVIKYEPHPDDIAESKVYLSKRLSADVLDSHRSLRRSSRSGEGASGRRRRSGLPLGPGFTGRV
jgi:hypothetical protein